MAFATMHFATGMVCSGAAGLVVCTVLRRGFRWLPIVATAGGFWAMVPDMPRLFREDFLRHVPVLNRLGEKPIEQMLHRNGDIFFFHHWLDTNRTEDRLALQGMSIIIGVYMVSVIMLMFMEWRARNSEANRFWQTHKPFLDRVQQGRPEVPNQNSDNPPRDTGNVKQGPPGSPGSPGFTGFPGSSRS